MNPQPSPIVVGVDGSEQALLAVDWAAGAARRHARPLRIVHAFEWPMFKVYLGPPAGGPPDSGLANAAQRIVDDAVARAREAVPEVVVSGEYVSGFRRAVLAAEARRAHVMVVGSRGLGGVGAVLIGSAGTELVALGLGPVVSVPEAYSARPEGEIVAAIDGSASCRAALRFALAEAATRDVGLRAVLAWQPPRRWTSVDADTPSASRADSEQQARERLGTFLASEDHPPTVEVTPTVVRGGARQVLIEQGRTAELLVVGSRGFGGFTGLLVGSVSHAVLHHAESPVAVVPSP
ncbi:universal stress protein [Lipingzhangella sp. LS1_29]|uniref:Universal stress protein n=1 Tax=Lipingzhangella rawalii TaxID=2055835 RepID=A0ABU2H991_9ACTN|nr:universal stress protein [Lipingzhangella rawalii]MDS1271872.1 universal stress protein [Lipingzhangella rawalii]